MPKITWKFVNGDEISADVPFGDNMMEAAVAANVAGVIGECGGCLSCATCHVFVDDSWVGVTGEFDDMEEAMLDGTEFPRQANSRLSCQIEATEAMDGLILHVPGE